MPRPTNLRLNELQETALNQYIDQRLESLDRENGDRIRADEDSRLRYENDRRDRAIPDSVFEQSNTPIPITSLVTDYFLSRAHDEILGEKPFFKTRPQGPSDRDLARNLERFATYKLVGQAKVDEEIEDSLLSAHIQRAAILKGVYAEETDEFEQYDRVALHDVQTGEPVMLPESGYVFDDAEWIEQPDPEAVVDPAQLQQPPMRKHLAADPSVILDPARYEFRPMTGPAIFKRTLFAGAKSVEVESKNFRAPMDARSLHEADFVAEYYDKASDWILDRFNERPWFKLADYETQLKTRDANAKTETKTEPLETKENLSFDLRTHRSSIAECWFTWDVLERGRPQRVVVWWDRELKRCIAYDYQANISPTGRHTYRSVSVAKNKKRWWGYSIPELVKFAQDYVDLQFNRHSFRNSINSNPIIGQNPNAILERKSFSELKPFEKVTLEDGKSMQDYLQAFVFPNAELDTEVLIDKIIYFVQLWLGISNVAQGDYSDVPQNTTAFGQDATLREAAKNSRRFIRRVQRGIRDHIQDLVEILVATMDDEEVFYATEGDNSILGSLKKDQVRGLSLDVEIVVGRAQNAQAIQATNLATQLVEKYATMLVTSPWMATLVRPLYKISLRLLGFDDIDTLLPDPANPQVAAMLPPMTGMVPTSGKDQQQPATTTEGNAANAGASIVNGPPESPAQDRSAQNGV